MIIIAHPLATYWTTLASLRVASRWERNEESDSTLLPGHYGKSTLPVYFKRLCADTAQQPGCEPLIMLLCALSPRTSIIIYQHRRRYISKTKKKTWIKLKTKQNKIPAGTQLIFCSGQRQLLWLTGWLNGREHTMLLLRKMKNYHRSKAKFWKKKPRNGSPGHTSTVAPERSQRLHFDAALETQAAIQCRRTHAHAHTKKRTAWVHAWQQAVRRFYGQHGSRFGNMWHIKEPRSDRLHATVVFFHASTRGRKSTKSTAATQ